MTTLFQIHATMNHLKAIVREMAPLWHSGDSILLLGETAAYLDWFQAYIKEMNYDDEFDTKVEDITALYVLSEDIEQLNNSAKINLEFSKATSITDSDWVDLTLTMDRVITLNSVS